MITKRTTLNNTTILFDVDKNIDKDIDESIKFIIDRKKLPFENVYVALSIPLFQKFMDKLNNNGIKYKEVSYKHNLFLVSI